MKTKIYIDNWISNQDNGTTHIFENIEDEKIKSALNELNGKTTTQLVFNTEFNQNTLLIGGGKNGQYIVTYIDFYTDDSFSLVNPHFANKEEEIALNCGGQEGMYPLKIVSDFGLLFASVKHFIFTGKIDDKLLWLNDNE